MLCHNTRYDLQTARDNYRLVCGGDKGMHGGLVQRFVEVQCLLMGPITPHTCEHIWCTLLKKEGALVRALMPTPTVTPEHANLQMAGRAAGVTTSYTCVTASAAVVTTSYTCVTASAAVVTTSYTCVIASAAVVTTSYTCVTASAAVVTTSYTCVTESAAVVTTSYTCVTASAAVVPAGHHHRSAQARGPGRDPQEAPQ
eukprot:3550088-Pyramimonas_sp.AAC.1